MLGTVDIIPTIIGILFLVLPSMLLGRLCSHFGISEIIGFVLGGVFLGPFALGGLIPFFGKPIVELNEIMLGLWQISGIIILFSAGLHFTFQDLRNAGIRSVVVGTMGVVTPLVLGYFISIWYGFDWTVSVLIGATLSATSIAISVTILEELGKEKSKEGNILVNAAVLDDILGLAVLSAVISIITLGVIPDVGIILTQTAESLVFWVLLLLGAVFILPKIVHGIAMTKPTSLEARGIKQGTALGSAFGLAALASAVGLNPIIGAFAAGMGLAGSKLATQVREFVGELKIIVAPLFFAIIGAHVNLGQIDDVDIVFFVIIFGVAVLSKILGSGVPAWLILKNRIQGMRIGYGMIARGEVAFITLGIGIGFGVISESVYSTLIIAILGTIIIAPTLLRRSYKSEN